MPHLLEKPNLEIPLLLEAHREEILAMLEPSVQLLVGTPGKAAENGSRLFGDPFLRHRGEWPRTPEGRPMFFVAQLNLAELGKSVQSIPWLSGRSGMLSFFYDLERMPLGIDPEDRYRFRLLWNPDSRKGQSMQVFSGTGAPGVEERPLTGLFTWRLPSEIDSRFLLGTLDEAESIAYNDLCLRTAGWNEHRLLGPADWVEGDARGHCQKAAASLFLDEHLPERPSPLVPTPSEWRLLWQISGEPDLNQSWGEDGKIFIMISEQDFACGRFDRSWALLQEG